MNILPKKRWHVRTKDNIARVRRDEAEAAEKEKQEQLRIHNADREARLSVLKNISRDKLSTRGIPQTEQEETVVQEHINLFSDLEHTVKTSNKDHDLEVKQKQEEYEKKIGYLTYLGQDTNEALKKKNWYEVMPDASRFSRSSDIKDTYDKLVLKDVDGKLKSKDLDIKDGVVAWKRKQELDPINAFKQYCHGSKSSTSKHKIESKSDNLNIKEKKSKKNKSLDHKDDKTEKLRKLREARLKREKEEKLKAEKFLVGLHGGNKDDKKEPVIQKIKPKYNSQFNPELARQNYY